MIDIKELFFIDNAYKEYIDLPDEVKQELGYKLWQVQIGRQPEGAKKLSGYKGVFELRVRGVCGIYRVFYTNLKRNKVIVLHSFMKKSQKTAKNNLLILKKRLKSILKLE